MTNRNGQNKKKKEKQERKKIKQLVLSETLCSWVSVVPLKIVQFFSTTSPLGLSRLMCKTDDSF